MEMPAPASKSNVSVRKITVIVLTYNSAHYLTRCLDTITWADEILIVDSYSIDNTVEVARRYTDAIFLSDLLSPANPGGYAAQRNFALSKSSGDWVFFVDSDECVSSELRLEIQARILNEDEGHTAYQVKRLDYYFGVPYEQGHCWQTRLLRKGQARYGDALVHETPEYSGSTGIISGLLLHYTKDTVLQYVNSINNYTSLEAASLLRQDAPLLRHPVMGMAHLFLLRYYKMQGYKEGTFGLIMSLSHAFYHYVTWAKHWEACKNAGHIPARSRPGLMTAVVGGLISGFWNGLTPIKSNLLNLFKKLAPVCEERAISARSNPGSD